MSNLPDEAMLERARGGDRDALDELIKRHQGQVYRFGMKMCRDPEDAKDVLQDTLLSMARGIRDFRGSSSVSTWLYTIARNFCIKKRRKDSQSAADQRSLDELGAGEEVADGERLPDEALAGKQIERALEAAIASLEPGYREVLLLRDVEGLTAPEVAEVIGISVAAVKSRLHRARLAVREQLEPLLGITPARPAPSCPDVLSLYSSHLEGDVSASMCADMERHLAACAACQASCDSLKRSLSLCRTAPPGEVPAALQAEIRAAIKTLTALK